MTTHFSMTFHDCGNPDFAILDCTTEIHHNIVWKLFGDKHQNRIGLGVLYFSWPEKDLENRMTNTNSLWATEHFNRIHPGYL